MSAANHLPPMLGLTALFGLTTAYATDFVVNTVADEPYDGNALIAERMDGEGLSLREAIGLANANTPVDFVGVAGAASGFGDLDGDTITIDPTLFSAIEPFTRRFPIGTEIAITDDVLIDGAIASEGIVTTSVLDGSNANRAFNIDTTAAPGDASAVTLRNFIIANTTAGTENGGAILIGETADVTIERTTFTDATAADGGAIYLTSGSLTIDRSNFTGGDATGASGSGGAIFNNGFLTISGTTFTENTAPRAGGAIESRPDTITALTDCIFTNNTAGEGDTAAPGNGGAFHITGGGMVTISGGEASRNIAAAEGGAFWNGSGTMAIVGTNIMDNIAAGDAADQGGGGIFNAGGTLSVINSSTITGNTATGTSGSGGGILNDGGTLGVIVSSITGNTANRAGGGIEATTGSTTNLTAAILDGNTAGPEGTAAPGNGGGLHISGTGNATITNGTASGNTAASEGGGLWNSLGTMLIDGTEITGNTATGNDADHGGGGVFNAGGTITIQNNAEITGNTATGTAGSGGGILNDAGTVAITSSAISDNTANRAGGGIEATPASTTTLTSVTLNGNIAGPEGSAAPGNGGGFHITGAADATITDSTASGNFAAAEGGALWNGAGTMDITGTTIELNSAAGDAADNGGGGIFNVAGTVNITGTTTITGNTAIGTAGSGGGILNQGTLTASGQVTITGNVANRAGGGLEATAGSTSTLTDVTFTTNTAGPEGTAAPGNGGAHHTSGPANVFFDRCLVSGNTAANQGGGLWNSGAAFLSATSSLISENTSPTGAGIYAQPGDAGITSIVNSTVTTNTGDGIFAGARVSLSSTTVAANTGAGVATSDLLLSLINTILADNVGQDLAISGSLLEATNSIVENGTIVSDSSTGNISGVDPLLSPLQDNGGVFLSHKPMAGSPALNAGTNAARGLVTLINDVRSAGFPRITGGIIDIGSVEGDPFTYAAFVAAFSDAVPLEDRSPEANPDGDALPNALEYLFGTDPENGSDGSPVLVSDNDDSILFSYPIAPGIPSGTDSIETSTDLTAFTLDESLTRAVLSIEGQATVAIVLPKEEGVPTKFARVRATPEISDSTGVTASAGRR